MRFKFSQNSVYVSGLFLLWPFLSIFFAFGNYKESWAKNVFWFFVAFFGYTMVISNSEIDANRLVADFEFYKDNVQSLDDLFDILKTQPDFFIQTYNYFITRIVENVRIYLLSLALIFGYFYSRNIWFLLDRKKGDFKLLAIFLFLLFVFVVPMWNINGFRFWTATSIFVFGIFNYFDKKQLKFLLFPLFTILIHYSFILPVAILALYLVLGKRTKSNYILYIVSFFFLSISPKFVNSSISSLNLPVSIENEISIYSSEEYVAQRQERRAGAMGWYVTLGPETAKYISLILISIVFFKYRPFLKKEKLESMFAFSLLMSSAALLFSTVPSGSRFIAVAYLFVFATLFLVIQNRNIKINSLIRNASIVSIVLYVLLILRVGLETIGVSAIIGNPMFSFIGNVDFALIELIK